MDGAANLFESPAAELIRVEAALSTRLERTLEAFPGVARAHVHVALPAADPLTALAKPPAPASASVVLEISGGSPPATPSIERVVSNAIAGLEPARVHVAFVAARPRAAETQPLVRVGPLHVAPSSRPLAIGFFSAALALIFALSCALIMTALRAQRGSTPPE